MLRELRQEKGLTQAALAERAHISVRTVQLVETGRVKPGLRVLAALRSVLGDGVLELLNQSQPENGEVHGETGGSKGTI